MDYFNNLGQLPTDEPMGYGISYLGIKPTAVGVVPIQPIQVQPITAPVAPQPISMPKPSMASAPMPKPVQQPSGIVPQPISKPMQQTFTPSPAFKAPENKPVAPPPAQVTGPITPDYGKSSYNLIQDDYNQMQNVEALPQSLQPISQPQMPQQPKPKFNQLSNLLNKGQMK